MMQVRDLIEALSKMDLDEEVVIFSSSGLYETITSVYEGGDHVGIETEREEYNEDLR